MAPRARLAGRLTLLVALAAILTLVLGPASRPLAKGQDAYEKLKVFSEVFSLIENSYVEEPDPEKLVYGAIRGMIKELDPHSGFLTADMFKEMQVDTKGEFGGLGIQISIKNDILTVMAPIEDTPAWKIGIKAGDQILKVDTQPTKNMTVEDAVKKMRGTPGTPVTLSIFREGFTEPKDFTIVRDIIKVKSVKARMVDKTIGLVRVTQFQERTNTDLLKALDDLKAQNKDLKGVILDLRNNPGGLLDQAVKVASEFLPNNVVVVSTRGRKGSQNTEYKSVGGDRIPGIPLVVLVNHGSASASEIVAGALQDWNRAIILGTKTFGKASVQTIIPLDDGSGVRLTTAKYYTPKGRSIQNLGIDPDIEVRQATITEGPAPPQGHPGEATLENRLENEQLPGAPEHEKKPTEVKDAKGTKPAEQNDEGRADATDYQLQRATDLLKSWNVFQKMGSTTTASAP